VIRYTTSCQRALAAKLRGENSWSLSTSLSRESNSPATDEKHFFIRGHLEIPILGHSETLALAVWSSLSETSFLHMTDRWNDADRQNDPPYFGWLSSRLPFYPDTVNLKLSVQSQAPGWVPLFTTEPINHPLSVDQHQGITIERWHELAHTFMGH